MLKSLFLFLKREDGAVTVDWVVLTAAVVGLAFVAIISIQGATGSVGSGVQDFLVDRPVGG
jgi:hypothetical protein